VKEYQFLKEPRPNYLGTDAEGSFHLPSSEIQHNQKVFSVNGLRHYTHSNSTRSIYHPIAQLAI